MSGDVLVVALDGVVCGVDRRSGRWLWKNELPGGGRGEVSLAITDDAIYASAFSPILYSLDLASGRERWRAKTQSSGRASILVDGDQVFCVKSGYIDCYDLQGALRWRESLKGAGVGPAAVGLPGKIVQADEAGSG